MAKFKQTSTRYLDAFLRDCFLNYLDNHNDDIVDDDCFEPLERFLGRSDWDKLVDEARAILPPRLFGEEPDGGESRRPASSGRIRSGARPRISRIEKAIKLSRATSSKKREGVSGINWAVAPREAMMELWRGRGGKRYARVLCRNAFDRIAKRFKSAANDPFRDRLLKLQKALKLDDVERDILALAYVLGMRLWDYGGDGCGVSNGYAMSQRPVFYAKCLDVSRNEASRALSRDGALRKFGLLNEELKYNFEMGGYLEGLSKQPLNSYFYGLCTDKPLPMDYYGEIASKHSELLTALLNSKPGGHAPSVLFYGAPGVGKTSFAKSLAESMGRECYFVAQQCAGTNAARGLARSDASPAFRFAALLVAQRNLDPGKSLVVVDESDEMIGTCENPLASISGGPQSASRGKGTMNDVLDKLTVPTIWISNSSNRSLDVSNRRRFDYSVRFDELNDAQRRAIWRNAIAKRKLGKLFEPAQIDRFASRYRTSAGGIAMVLDNVARLACTPKNVEARIEALMKQHCELLGLVLNDRVSAPARDYSLEGLNVKTQIALDRIVEAIRRFYDDLESGRAAEDAPRMNLLLSGPPGTGKTEFVKYLASRLNRRVCAKTGSALLGPYVGETEQRIAEAFRTAETTGSILFMDELDGLAQTREGASHRWEMTQVNEILQQMENFAGVMVGATNFAGNLDPATVRRFTFKVEFDFLTDEGKRIFFERMFHATLSEKERTVLDGIRNLAPGDFRTARQSLYYLGDDATNDDRLTVLLQESRAKSGSSFAKGGRLGF